jgi:hypothetical protein
MSLQRRSRTEKEDEFAHQGRERCNLMQALLDEAVDDLADPQRLSVQDPAMLSIDVLEDASMQKLDSTGTRAHHLARSYSRHRALGHHLQHEARVGLGLLAATVEAGRTLEKAEITCSTRRVVIDCFRG